MPHVKLTEPIAPFMCGAPGYAVGDVVEVMLADGSPRQGGREIIYWIIGDGSPVVGLCDGQFTYLTSTDIRARGTVLMARVNRYLEALANATAQQARCAERLQELTNQLDVLTHLLAEVSDGTA